MRRVARLAVALHAVSTSPAMTNFPRYVREVERLRPRLTRLNPPAARLGAAFDAIGAPSADVPGAITALDLMAALSSFTDDYAKPPPRAPFAVEVAERLLAALEGQRGLTVTEQLALALSLAPNGLFEAVLGLHTATRVLARGRDRRLSRTFALSMDERLERGRAIAPFHPDDSRGGDPLGDTYHFWANVSGGVYAATTDRTRAQRGFVAGMLYAGPWLMRGVREATFKNPLFYGDHARIDRLGLSMGFRLGRGG